MMTQEDQEQYAHGPTVCGASRNVVRNIKALIKHAHALSPADVRLAEYMGLLSINAERPTGLNDGVFYPPSDIALDRAPAKRPLRAARLARASAQPRKMHALALLVDFDDNVGTRPASEFHRMLFDASNPDSMTNFYKELSNGKLLLTGEVKGYLRAPQPYAFYTDGKSGTGRNFPNNTPGLLRDALDLFCATDNLKRFDTDGDGVVDGIFLIHAGGGAEAEPDRSKRPHMIWSHKWTLPKPFVNRNIKVFAYSTEPEDGRLGVFAHEFGHVLGLPDLYDTSYRSEGVGTWCLMSGGSWGGAGKRPTRMSCWCLSKLGWIKPRVTGDGNYVLASLADQPNDCLRVPIGARNSPEYFLFENRQKRGRDAALPTSGLALWHIDERQSGNTNPLAYKVGLVQADGKRDLEMNRNGGDAGDLFPGKTGRTTVSDRTNPSTRDNAGNPSGIAISAIKATAGKVSFKLKT